MVSQSTLTFRLRGCPATVDEVALCDALAQAFGDIDPDDIHLQSLARAVDPWETPSTKTATLRFAKLPSVVQAQISRGEWKIEGSGLNNALILDSHFLGLTPLNDVGVHKHKYDCIAISGLSSHPFGSWQSKNSSERSWMWIRDNLPKAFPEIRTVLFGVPSRGMETQALMTMVNGRPNQDLVRDLTAGSEYLHRLDDRFFEVARCGRMELFWAYETKTSPTVAKQADGSFARTGPEEILVTPESATRGLYGTNSTSIFAINENHSDMVKFGEGDANCHIVLGKLKETCAAYEETSYSPEAAEDASLAGRKRDVLKTLFTLSYRERKDRNPDRIPGTCEWFATHHFFQQWQESKSSTMLWVSADPGCGKSVLAKHLVDSVLPATKARTTCYFFFKDVEDQRSATSALSCILHQLFEQREILLSAKVVERFEMYGERLTNSFGELWDLLLAISRDTKAGEIVCILDAFDECEDTAQSELAKALCKFFGSGNNSNLKFLITSRPLGKIRRAFQPLYIPGVPVIRLKGESDIEAEKITNEIDVYIRTRVRNIQELFQLKPDEAELLLKKLLRVPNRTYLWVHLTLDLIETSINIDKVGIEKATSVLPQTVDEAYDRILAKSCDSQESKRLLSIVVAATRPLTLAEMALALTIREEHVSYGDLDLKSEGRFREYVRDLCGLFVTVVASKIYLLHQTAKEFLVQDGPVVAEEDVNSQLKWKWSLRLEECHHILWQISTWYLLFTEFEINPLDDNTEELSQYLYDHLFLGYSAKNWAAHFRLSSINGDDTVKNSLLAICDAKSGRCRTWFRIYWASAHGGVPQGFTTLMIASYFGIGLLVGHLMKGDGVELCSTDGTYRRSALSWASENGFDDVVKLLLRRPRVRFKDMVKLSFPERLNINTRDKYGRTPLSYAALNGHVAIAKLLIKARARADSEDDIGGTPISYAIFSGEEAVISLLQKRGSMASSADNIMRKLLLSAAKKGDDVVVKRLLGTDKTDADVMDEKGRTPLSLAAEKGHTAVLQLLLDTGKVDIEAKDTHGRTPLLWAAGQGHTAMVQLLLDTGKVDIEAKDAIYGQTPLSWAAEKGGIRLWYSCYWILARLILRQRMLFTDRHHSRGLQKRGIQLLYSCY
ncbi:hypothetical protein B0H67DRAFT_102434 [Lasiosphaeris hirsuta]|uniref:Ankyrin repeat protein n=1 Tax=Lasiosphaeris hirsuta TaxID=260670 RepID=A0AA40E6J6_9PEZI|nr:hypothetical protein B0H67DRAFT_102434 [Lasiosphaeris hirsuta]